MIAGLIVLLCLVAGIVIIIILARNAGLQKKQATFVDQEHFEFVYAGGDNRSGTLSRILVNSKGLRYLEDHPHNLPVTYWKLKDGVTEWSDNKDRDWDKTSEDIPVRFAIVEKEIAFSARPGMEDAEKKTLPGVLRNKWGWFYVGITYPLVHILEFKIERARIVEGGESTRQHVRNLVDRSTSEEKPAFVKSFLIRFPRPVVATDVEFKDKYTADVAMNLKCRVIIPLRTIPTWGDKFFEQLELTVIGGLGDVCRQMNYDKFIESFAIGPKSAFYDLVLSRLNLTTIPTLGVIIEDGWVVDRELSGKSKELEEALQAEKTATLKAKAAVAAAEGQGNAEIALKTREGEAELAKSRKIKEAKKEIGLGEGEAFKAQVDALVQSGLKPHEAAQVVMQKLRMEAIRDTELETFVEGGAQAGVFVGTKPSSSP